jgi:hypothetical protein
MAGQAHGRARLRRASVTALLVAAALALAGCDDAPDELTNVGSETSSSPSSGQDGSRSPESDASPSTGPSSDPTSETDGPADDDGAADDDETGGGTGTDDTSYAVDPPGPFEGLHRSDVLITATESLPDKMVERIRNVPGVESALPLSVGSASVNGRTLTIAAVDPGRFRSFTPDATARADFVWERVAGGEIAVDTDVDKKLISKQDMIQLGSDEDSPLVHVGAFAPLITRSPNTPQERPAIQAVVNEKRGEQIGIEKQNAILVDTGQYTPSFLAEQFEKILGDDASMSILALEFDGFGETAVLTGQSVSDAVGTFTYTNGPDGTIVPDQGWVREYIRTEAVPILGTVTCNKGMLPQLRGALTEIQLMGLADAIHPDEYAGCYYPRYIARDPSNGLSLHSWGIAVDLNVPGNLRGTVGEMDRGVVAIFKKWGFAWGGDWNYTDPMHFEMSKVVRAGEG